MAVVIFGGINWASAYLFGLLVSAVGEQRWDSVGSAAISRWWIEQLKLPQASSSPWDRAESVRVDDSSRQCGDSGWARWFWGASGNHRTEPQCRDRGGTIHVGGAVDIRQLVTGRRIYAISTASRQVKLELDGLKAVYKMPGKNFDPVQ